MALRIHPDLVLHDVVLSKCPAYDVDFQFQFSSSQSHSSFYVRVTTFLRFRKLELPLEIGSKSSLKRLNVFSGTNNDQKSVKSQQRYVLKIDKSHAKT